MTPSAVRPPCRYSVRRPYFFSVVLLTLGPLFTSQPPRGWGRILCAPNCVLAEKCTWVIALSFQSSGPGSMNPGRFPALLLMGVLF